MTKAMHSIAWLLIAFSTPSMFSAEPGHGSICIAPNSMEPPTRVSPGQMYNPATLAVRIDKGKALAWPHKEGLKIEDLDLGKRHLFVVISDGKPVQSFWFRFEEFQSSELCASFDGYQGVQLNERKHLPWCKCK